MAFKSLQNTESFQCTKKSLCHVDILFYVSAHSSQNTVSKLRLEINTQELKVKTVKKDCVYKNLSYLFEKVSYEIFLVRKNNIEFSAK